MANGRYFHRIAPFLRKKTLFPFANKIKFVYLQRVSKKLYAPMFEK